MKKVATKVFLVLLLGSPLAMAQTVDVGELQKKGAVKLSAQEVRTLVDGARVEYWLENRWRLQWKNDKEGKLAVSATPPSGSGPETRSKYARGSWSVQDDGKYCVELVLPETAGKLEKWCRDLLRAGKQHYSSNEATGKAHEIKFRKK